MRNITEERRKLTEMYYGLKERLDELNKLETLGLNNLSIKGYVDLHNEHTKNKSVNNIKREMSIAISRAEESEKEKELIPKRVIEESKEKEDKKTKKKFLNLDKVVGNIAHVLKDKGTPMKVVDIHAKVQEVMDTNIEINNFRNNILPRATKKNENIQKVMRGYYQYKQ